MPDERSPIRRALVLRRVDPDRGVTRFHSLLSVRDLFGTIQLVRNWGRIGTNGQELVEVFATEIEAGEARGRRPRETPARKSKPKRVEGEGRRHHLGRSAITPSRSTYPDPACHLPVALPVGTLVRNQRILHRGLHIPPEVHRP